MPESYSVSIDFSADDLSSERFGANYYIDLRDLLAAQDWKAADQETANRMCEVMNRQTACWLRDEDIKNFPCLDLRNIDRLWVKYSQGKFGFSVQKEIWQSCGSPTMYNRDWEEFGDAVGWKDPEVWPGWAAWCVHNIFMFEYENVQRGHLPSPKVAPQLNLNFDSRLEVGIVFLLAREDL